MNSTTTPENDSAINFPILELGYIHKILYNDGSEHYHFEVSYLVQIGGIETVLEVHPTRIHQLFALPMIDLDTVITVYLQLDNGATPVGKTTVREQAQ